MAGAPRLPEEAPVVAAAARALLRELDATPPAPDAMEAAARTLIADRDAGEVFLADAGGAIVGCSPRAGRSPSTSRAATG